MKEMLEKSDSDNKKTKTQESILSKLYQPQKKKWEQEDKISNCFFIRVPKVMVIYRKPISPYITEKVEIQ